MSNLNLTESEHKLTSPELIGTDEEKISALHYWSDIVGLLRSLNVTIVSFENKVNILAAIKQELELINSELHNVSAELKGVEAIPTLEQPPTEIQPEDEAVDLSSTEEPQAPKLPKFSSEAIAQLRRMAGVGR